MKEIKVGVCIFAVHMFCLIALFLGPAEVNAQQTIESIGKVFVPQAVEPEFSQDRTTLYNAQPAKVFIADPNPPKVSEYIPPPAGISKVPYEESTAGFVISYVPNGGQDLWGEACYSFPEPAKVALLTAASVWARLLNSSVPITIRACWGDLGADSGTLGYSGGGAYHRNFTGAPSANTWYVSSLANAIAGRDLSSSSTDMHITFNSELPGVYHWNFRVDGNVEPDEYDFMSTALHEICHGLGFLGSMTGSEAWGIDGDPMIYDLFTKGTYGVRLIDYDDSSPYSLSDMLTIGRVYFHGKNAMAANGGKRVELFTPDFWMSGSSYSHLDMDYYYTPDKLMVYMMARDNATHSPGPITLGLLKDLGWPSSTVKPPDPPAPPPEEEKHFMPFMLLLGGNSMP